MRDVHNAQDPEAAARYLSPPQRRDAGRVVRDATPDDPTCDLCGQAGLNMGKPAQPAGRGGFAHVGCLSDRARDEYEAYLDYREAIENG